MRPSDPIGSTHSQASAAMDQTEQGHQQELQLNRTQSSSSWSSTQSNVSSLDTPHVRKSPRRDVFRISTVEGSRVFVKLDTGLEVKKVFMIYGSFGRLLRGLEEIFAIEQIPGTPSMEKPVCRVGRNVALLTSTVSLPFTRNISSERTWCFRSDSVTQAVDLHFPLIPEVIRRAIPAIQQPTLTKPFAVIFFRRISHDKTDRTTILEALELRSIEATGQADIEVFAMPMDRKTEKVAYSERIFLGENIIRLVTECSVSHPRLAFTEVTRHFWKSDLKLLDPALNTARDSPISSARVGTMGDTSAGSPPDSNSPFSQMQWSGSVRNPSQDSRRSSESKVQKLLQRRRELNRGSSEDTRTAITPTGLSARTARSISVSPESKRKDHE